MDQMQSLRARIRWRARRGLLENDLIITKFLDEHEKNLNDEQVVSLITLFELDDNDLLEILLGLSELQGKNDTPTTRHLVDLMRSAK